MKTILFQQINIRQLRQQILGKRMCMCCLEINSASDSY